MAFSSGSGTGCAAPTAGSAISRAIALLAGAWLLVGATPVARLELDFEALRSTKGMVRVCLTADPDNFPSCVDDARALSRSVPAATRSVAFDGLPVGTYAAAVIHDENGNRKLDTMLGIPREGFGFSRNPVIRFSAPKFAAARFTLPTAGDAEMIRMKYLF